MKDGLELFKQFADNDDFRHFLEESVFRAAYRLRAAHVIQYDGDENFLVNQGMREAAEE